MTTITDRGKDWLYKDDDRIIELEVEVTAEAIYTSDEVALKAVTRLNDIIDAELQAIQDEIDEGEFDD